MWLQLINVVYVLVAIAMVVLMAVVLVTATQSAGHFFFFFFIKYNGESVSKKCCYQKWVFKLIGRSAGST